MGKKGSVGVIPQETILPAGSDPLSSSTGIPDPVNLKGAATLGTVAANPQWVSLLMFNSCLSLALRVVLYGCLFSLCCAVAGESSRVSAWAGFHA